MYNGFNSVSAVSIFDFCEFLRLNGQKHDELNMFGTNSPSSQVPEDFESSLLSWESGNELVRIEGVDWNELQNVTIITSHDTFKNPWSSRLSFGGREAFSWQQEVRRKGKLTFMFI
jgi:hypothetical protein